MMLLYRLQRIYWFDVFYSDAAIVPLVEDLFKELAENEGTNKVKRLNTQTKIIILVSISFSDRTSYFYKVTCL